MTDRRLRGQAKFDPCAHPPTFQVEMPPKLSGLKKFSQAPTPSTSDLGCSFQTTKCRAVMENELRKTKHGKATTVIQLRKINYGKPATESQLRKIKEATASHETTENKGAAEKKTTENKQSKENSRSPSQDSTTEGNSRKAA